MLLVLKVVDTESPFRFKTRPPGEEGERAVFFDMQGATPSVEVQVKTVIKIVTIVVSERKKNKTV